jgi:hypothetical protein
MVARDPGFVYVAWLIVLGVWALSLVVAYVTWIVGFPMLWGWAGSNVGRIIAAVIGSIFLFCIPIWGWIAAESLTRFVVDTTLTDEAVAVADARERVRTTEADVLGQLETSDTAGLLPLLRYSRAQLDAYYVMGLAQTRRSFVNAAIAMWLGFLILLVGLTLQVVPLERFGVPRPTTNINILVISGTLIVEVISALFLWVYRSTIGQLTFYYRLQMQAHTAILSFRIATTMTTKDSDAAKRAIIDKLLDSAMAPERPAMVGTKGLSARLET